MISTAGAVAIAARIRSAGCGGKRLPRGAFSARRSAVSASSSSVYFVAYVDRAEPVFESSRVSLPSAPAEDECGEALTVGGAEPAGIVMSIPSNAPLARALARRAGSDTALRPLR
jgi:hypothetical protein